MVDYRLSIIFLHVFAGKTACYSRVRGLGQSAMQTVMFASATVTAIRRSQEVAVSYKAMCLS